MSDKKKYDFSAFDEGKKSEYDFSAFDDERSPAAEESSEPVSQSRAALLGAGQGATFGFDDEISGGMAALLSLFDPDNKSSMGDVYTGVRDITREEQKAAQEQHSGTHLVGNLAGGVLSGAGLAKAGIGAGLSKGAPLAKDAMGPVWKASAMQNILNAGKVGMGSGAVTGLGMNESDLTTGEGLGQAAKEMAGTAAMGGVLGAGLTAGVEGGKAAVKGTYNAAKNFAKNNEFLSNIGEAFSREKAGDQVVGQGVRRAMEGEMNDSAIDLVNKLDDLKARMGQAKGAELAKNKDLMIDYTNTLNVHLEKLRQLPENTPQELADKNTAIQFIEKKLSGFTKDLEVPVIESEGEKVLTAAQPSGLEKASKITSKKLERERIEGGNITPYEMVTSPDGQWLTPHRIIDEIHPSENAAFEPIKKIEMGKGSREKIQKELSALKSTAKLRGENPNQFEIIDDPQEGWHHIVKKDLAGGQTTQIPDTLASVPNTPAIPAQMEHFPQTEGVQSASVQMPGTGVANFETQDQFRKSAQQLTAVGDNAIKSPNAQRAMQSVVKDLGKDLTNVETGAPGLATANKNFSHSAKALELVGAENQFGTRTDFDTSKLANDILARAEQDALVGGKTRRLVNEIIKQVKNVDPKLATELESTIGDKASKFDLVRKINKEGMFNQPKLALANKANILAVAGYTGRAIKGVKDITALSPEWLKKIGTQMLAAGGKGSAIGKAFVEAANKDNVGRNALLFSLEQDPQNRAYLRETFGWDEKNNK